MVLSLDVKNKPLYALYACTLYTHFDRQKNVLKNTEGGSKSLEKYDLPLKSYCGLNLKRFDLTTIFGTILSFFENVNALVS